MQVDLHFMFVTKLHMGSGMMICTTYTHSFLFICTRFVSCDDCACFLFGCFDFMQKPNQGRGLQTSFMLYVVCTWHRLSVCNNAECIVPVK